MIPESYCTNIPTLSSWKTLGGAWATGAGGTSAEIWVSNCGTIINLAMENVAVDLGSRLEASQRMFLKGQFSESPDERLP